MTTRTYGFARPIKLDDVKPGMLISADYQGRRVIALAFQGDREVLAVVFRHDAEARGLPYVLEMSDIFQTLTVIEGERELEPIGTSFALLSRPRALEEGFVIAANGAVGLAFKHNDFGNIQWKVIDFDTGAPLDRSGSVLPLPPARLFIREPGRDEVRELMVEEVPAATAG